MTLPEVMTQLEAAGNPGTKKVLEKHGAKEPHFGVKVADLKKIVKQINKEKKARAKQGDPLDVHALSLKLYATGNSDAMYLAGLIADESQMNEAILDEWADQAYWYYISEYAVPWVAAETPFAWEIGNKWIKSDKPQVAAAGWACLASYAGLKPDEELDVNAYRALLSSIPDRIHQAPNRVRYVMNGFVIATGTYITALTDYAKEIGAKYGKVSVEMGGTACKVPVVGPYLKNVEEKGRLGKKRKGARC